MVIRVAADEVSEELLRLIKQTTPAFDIVAEKEKNLNLNRAEIWGQAGIEVERAGDDPYRAMFRRLVGIRVTGPDDPYPVIGKSHVLVGQLHFRHVAAHTI
jgi:hypothetical protein